RLVGLDDVLSAAVPRSAGAGADRDGVADSEDRARAAPDARVHRPRLVAALLARPLTLLKTPPLRDASSRPRDDGPTPRTPRARTRRPGVSSAPPPRASWPRRLRSANRRHRRRARRSRAAAEQAAAVWRVRERWRTRTRAS